MAMPEYTDGVLELLRIEDCSQDFPVEKVRSTGMHIWYRAFLYLIQRLSCRQME